MGEGQNLKWPDPVYDSQEFTNFVSLVVCGEPSGDGKYVVGFDNSVEWRG